MQHALKRTSLRRASMCRSEIATATRSARFASVEMAVRRAAMRLT